MNNLIIFLANDGMGGVQEGIFTLCEFLAKENIKFQLFCVVKTRSPAKFNLKISYLNSKRIFNSIPKILNILIKNEKSSNIICGQPHLNIILIFLNILIFNKHNLFITEHNPSFKSRGFKNKLIDYLKIYFYQFPKAILCVSTPLKKQLQNYKLLKKVNFEVVYNPVNIAKFNRSLTYRKNKTIKKFIFVGRLHQQKNLDLMLKTMSILKKRNLAFILNIIGEGNEMKSLKELSKKLCLEKEVKFLGRKNNINYYLKNSDIFLLSSIYEGFGISLVEAMLCGLQIVSTNTEGPKEILNNSEFGYLTDFNPNSFSEGIINAINCPKDPLKIIDRAKKLSQPKNVWKRYKKVLES